MKIYEDLIKKHKILEEVKLKIAQKEGDVLLSVYNTFGGYLAKTKRGEWEYDSTSFTVAENLIEYLKWRDCYRIIQKNEHFTEKGLNKIIVLKKFIKIQILRNLRD